MAMLEGLQAFGELEVTREETPHRVIWRKANARLLDYGGTRDAPAVLCVPSLINRHHILDLSPKRSLVRFLRDAGLRVCTLDWDEPGLREKSYHCGDYVSYLLLDALQALRAQHRGPVFLLGYCMGGVLATAAAQIGAHQLAGLVLLATPWRFSAPPLRKEDWDMFEAKLMQQDTIPPLWTQTVFHLLDPWRFQEKFARFNHMSPAEQRHFALVEHWVNDGVKLARGVARECYIAWPRDNVLATGRWQVRGRVINPAQLACPAFVATPAHDRIVPPACAAPLADAIPVATRHSPQSGHVSMVVGHKAKTQLWQPLLAWLEDLAY